jgi:hypothetical protein
LFKHQKLGIGVLFVGAYRKGYSLNIFLFGATTPNKPEPLHS